MAVSLRSLSVIVADDHPVVLRGIISFLSLEEGFTVVASCSDGAECIKAIRDLMPNIAVLDMNMPKLNGIEVLAAVTAEGLSTRIIFLAGSPDDSQIIAAVAGGAYGILLKESAPETLMSCLRAVAAGQKWFPDELVNGALEREKERSPQEIALDLLLTEREHEVACLVARGWSNKRVGNALDISEGTIKIHLYNIYRKVGSLNRTALTIMYRDRREKLTTSARARTRSTRR